MKLVKALKGLRALLQTNRKKISPKRFRAKTMNV